MISLLQLGIIDYATGLRLQQKLVDLRKEDRIGDVLLLQEHTPVITLGRNAKSRNVLASPEQLTERGVEVFECDRGGDVTYHGPGQLVGYPIFDLRSFASHGGKRKTLGAVEFVRHLEEVLIRTCADFGVATGRIAGLTGVWTNPRSGERSRLAVDIEKTPTVSEAHMTLGEAAKIAAIGIHVSRGITSHGFALNVNTDLDQFQLIIPCGITSKPVTSLAKELGHPLLLKEVANSASHNFGMVFNSGVMTIESLDALLGHSVGVPLKPPSELRNLHKEEDIFWA
ncbi:MAG: lipoyl(octanoyl) transferase LipB [Acidobacteria bacterium]|nr:MAG: lipoyl(octanoyl) transferase LipB [Acidobacteriota bacterium]